MREILNKEIDLIQSCIARMSKNSFMIKGWLITVIVAILTVLGERLNYNVICCICIFITFLCWYLDAYFLKIERLYRMKYRWVIKNRMKSGKWCYDLNPHNREMWLEGEHEPKIINIIFSKSIIVMYMPIVITIILYLSNSLWKGEFICIKLINL